MRYLIGETLSDEGGWDRCTGRSCPSSLLACVTAPGCRPHPTSLSTLHTVTTGLNYWWGVSFLRYPRISHTIDPFPVRTHDRQQTPSGNRRRSTGAAGTPAGSRSSLLGWNNQRWIADPSSRQKTALMDD